MTHIDNPQHIHTGNESNAASLPSLNDETIKESKQGVLLASIDAAIETLSRRLSEGRSESLVEYLKFMSRFYRYSFRNSFLIACACPDATHVAGYGAWKKQFGRDVRKGEKGIPILAPVLIPVENEKEGVTREKKSETRLVGYRVVYVFDVSQTEGAALPDISKVSVEVGDYFARLREFAEKSNITVKEEPLSGGALGASYGGSITLSPGLSDAEATSVLVHELAHELLHWQSATTRAADSKTVRETEAEAVAFVVCHHMGLSVSDHAADYIQLYQGDPKLLAASIDSIQRASAKILDAILAPGKASGGNSRPASTPSPSGDVVHGARNHTESSRYLFHWAMLYAERGWSFFPTRGKSPAISSWKDYQSTRPNLDQIREWFAEPEHGGIAIVTGRVSDLVVVDCDSQESADNWRNAFPATPLAVRTARGVHFYYRYPADTQVGNRVKSRAKGSSFCVDLRGEGGYVIAPASVHSSGHEYAWEGNAVNYSLIEVPVFDPAWIEPERERTSADVAAAISNRGVLRPIRDVARYVAAVRAIQGQGGDKTTFMLALRLRDAGLDSRAVYDVLVRWNDTNAIPPWSEAELSQKVNSAFKRSRPSESRRESK